MKINIKGLYSDSDRVISDDELMEYLVEIERETNPIIHEESIYPHKTINNTKIGFMNVRHTSIVFDFEDNTINTNKDFTFAQANQALFV